MVTLPYDAMIHEKRQPKCINSYNTGYYPGGAYLYSKRFWVAEAKHMVVEFEGVYGITEVFLNKKKMAENVYGYTNFFVCLDENLAIGEENEILVKVDNRIEDVSRWYSGSGIYRDVNLYVSDGDICIPPESLRVTTLSVDEAAKLKIQAVLENKMPAAYEVNVLMQIWHQGELIKEKEERLAVPSNMACDYETEMTIENPCLWDEKNPNLYQAKMTIGQKGEAYKDAAQTTFGIRTLAWSAKEGLLVNGKEVKLRGGCVHHDNGMLGANTNIQTERRRVRKIKEAGFNAIRSAHNPMGKLLLQACDEMGVYVMDETFDVWYAPKGDNYFQYCRYFNEWWKKDTQAMVCKDYNHPSVIMYSIGNEIFETAFDRGIHLAGQMRETIRELDETRPVTCCVNLFMNGMIKEEAAEPDYSTLTPRYGERDYEEEYTSSKEFNIMMNNMKSMVSKEVVSSHIDQVTKGVFSKMDVSGYNYAVERYDIDQTLHPERIILGSETVACDVDKNWKAVLAHKNVIGDFIWTAYDHLGECGIGAVDYEDMSYYKRYPYRTSGTGVIGINGNFTPLAYFTQIVYGLRKDPYLAVEPYDHAGEEKSLCSLKFTNGIHSWDWKGCEGNVAKVFVLCDAKFVELYLNGELLGCKEVADRAFVEFEVAYRAGKLLAKIFDEDGSCIGMDCLETPGEEMAIVLKPEVENKKKGSLIYVPIRVEDEDGNVHNISGQKVWVEVSGAELVALGSEALKSEEDFHGDETCLYQGAAMAIIRVQKDDAPIGIKVSCELCKMVETRI